MNDLLIVASSTSSPLCTDMAVPHDRQPQWWRRTLKDGSVDRVRVMKPEYAEALRLTGWTPDGPFPFTVARWAEVERDGCPKTVWDDGVYRTRCSLGGDGTICSRHGKFVREKIGAIVELVEIVGPSHEAKDCYGGTEFSVPSVASPYGHIRDRRCHPDALPDCWHTPTGTVTPIDPIVCERPTVRVVAGYAAWGNVNEGPPRPSHWVADDETAEKIRKVMA